MVACRRDGATHVPSVSLTAAELLDKRLDGANVELLASVILTLRSDNLALRAAILGQHDGHSHLGFVVTVRDLTVLSLQHATIGL